MASTGVKFFNLLQLILDLGGGVVLDSNPTIDLNISQSTPVTPRIPTQHSPFACQLPSILAPGKCWSVFRQGTTAGSGGCPESHRSIRADFTAQ